MYLFSLSKELSTIPVTITARCLRANNEVTYVPNPDQCASYRGYSGILQFHHHHLHNQCGSQNPNIWWSGNTDRPDLLPGRTPGTWERKNKSKKS